MTKSWEERALEAELDAAAWRKLAASYRTKIRRENAPWRKRCRKLQEALVDAEEKIADYKEADEDRSVAITRATEDLESRLVDALNLQAESKKRAEAIKKKLDDLEGRMRHSGSLEALIVERDELRARVDRMKDAVDHSAGVAVTEQRRAMEASQRLFTVEKDLREAHDRITREVVQPARARIRVLAARLQIGPEWIGYADDDKLTAEVDRRIHALQAFSPRPS